MAISIASSNFPAEQLLPQRDSALSVSLPNRFAPVPEHNFKVVRDRALRELTEASLCKQLTIIHGSAGAGKSALLGQWSERLRSMGQMPVWLTLEPSDSEPAHFFHAVGDACAFSGEEALGAEFHEIARSVSAMPDDMVARHVAAAINRRGSPLLLILDAYERADSPSLGMVLCGLAHHCPRLHVVLATRRRPAFPLGALRARNQIFELTPSRLHFSAAETKAVMGDLLPELYAHHLYAKTDGLPVAVQFARRALDENRPLGEPCGWQDWLDDYFRSEVLELLSDELKEVVRRLVIVDRFDLSLAQALAGSKAGAAMERLHRVEAILLRDPYGSEYHFPDMLRCFLADRLLSVDGHVRAELHASAADWFEQRGLNHEAFQHAIASGDRSRSLALLERIGGMTVVMQKGVVGARELLDAMALETGEIQPIPHLSFAMILAHEGRVQEAVDVAGAVRVHFAERNVPSHSAQYRELILVESFLAGFRDEPFDPDRLAVIEDALSGLEPGAHDARAQAHTVLSWQYYLKGDLGLAEQSLNLAADEYAGSEGIYGSLFLHVHHALVGFWRNDLDGALAESCLAERLASLFFPEDQRLRILTDIVRGSLLFELGEFQSDIQLIELAGLAGGIEGWTEIQLWAHSFAARNAMALGRLVEARAICVNACEIAERLGTPRLDWSLRCLRMGFEASHGCPGTARAEIEALGLADGAYLHRPELGWQERIGGALAAAQCWVHLKERTRADAALELARRQLQQLPIPRFQAMLHMCEAHLAEDSDQTRRHVKAARSCFPGAASTPIMMNLNSEISLVEPCGSPSAAAAGPAAQDNPLTLRERQILEYIGEGHPSKVAAYRFGLSEATIKFHLRNIYRKLKARNRTQALARYRTLDSAGGLRGKSL